MQVLGCAACRGCHSSWLGICPKFHHISYPASARDAAQHFQVQGGRVVLRPLRAPVRVQRACLHRACRQSNAHQTVRLQTSAEVNDTTVAAPAAPAMETVTRTRRKVLRLPLKLSGPGFLRPGMTDAQRKVPARLLGAMHRATESTCSWLGMPAGMPPPVAQQLQCSCLGCNLHC